MTTGKSAYPIRWAAACLLVVAVVRGSAHQSWAGAPINFEAYNVETSIYAEDFLQPVALLKIERVFNDHQQIGFFRVRLLPVLVAQGVRVELTQAARSTNWPAAFQFKPALSSKSGSIQWRDVSVMLPNETAPRLQVKRAFPLANGHPESCLLEGVTLQTDACPLKVARARLLLTGSSGRVVWENAGESFQWDLFTNNLHSAKTIINQDNRGNPP